jgi:FkbM family methyltransferase
MFFALEANPEVYGVLLNFISLNKLSNVTALNLAIGDIQGWADIKITKDSYLGGSINNNSSESSYCVEMIPLNNLISRLNLSEIDFLKYNIQGAERYLCESIHKRMLIIRNYAIACHDFRFKRGDGVFFETKDLIMRKFQDLGMPILKIIPALTLLMTGFTHRHLVQARMMYAFCITKY